MKLNILHKAVMGLGLVALMGFTAVSCTESDSELVSFQDDNNLDSPNDTIYSIIGIIGNLQKVADRTILLGEVRGDLTVVTEAANTDLQDLANFKAKPGSTYNDARDYYAIIQNCNYYLANVNADLVLRGRKVFEKEIAVVRTYRAWAYLQLAINYGSVPFTDQPVLTEADANPASLPKYDLQQICDYFINDLQAYTDTELPSYGNVGGVNSKYFYIPVRLLLGDLCLWGGHYSEAARYYHAYLTKENNTVPTFTDGVRWYDQEFENVRGSISASPICFIPMAAQESDGQVSYLGDVFCSTVNNNDFYQVTRSTAYDQLSRSQKYTLVYINTTTNRPDTVSPPEDKVYENEQMRGDLRQWMYYTTSTNRTATSNQSSLRQTVMRWTPTVSSGGVSGTVRMNGSLSGYVSRVPLYRDMFIYLRYAEAMNRAGFPQTAFAVLKYGLWRDNIEKYIDENERNRAGDLLNFSQYEFLRTNTQGIHARGSGDADANKEYAIPDLTTRDDSILWVENAICDEMALETATEGQRYFDLMRLSMHRGDPSFLADKVARRSGTRDEQLYQLLCNQQNWYLKIE